MQYIRKQGRFILHLIQENPLICIFSLFIVTSAVVLWPLSQISEKLSQIYFGSNTSMVDHTFPIVWALRYSNVRGALLMLILATAMILLMLIFVILGLKKAAESIRDSKNFLDATLESIGEMLITISKDYKILDINRRARQLLEYEKLELIGKNLDAIMPEDTSLIKQEAAANNFSLSEISENSLYGASSIKTMLHKDIVHEMNSCFVTKTGTNMPVILTASTLRNKQGNSTGYLLLAKDARESRLVKELKQKQSQLIQSAKLASLGELSSGIAHELNNPLFLIQGFNNRIKELLTEKSVGEGAPIQQYVKDVEVNCHRMVQIIDHLRKFARQNPPVTQLVNVNEIIESASSFIHQQLSVNNIILSKNYDEQAFVYGDPHRLEQMFVNLLNNAKDAILSRAPKPNGMLSIRTKLKSQSLLIEIEDNGEGIEESNLTRIFDPFFTTKPVGKGTGLGLSISHEIIKEHKGTIQCTSKKGQGSKFLILLPAATATEVASKQVG